MIPGLSYHNEPGKTATHPDPATPVRGFSFTGQRLP